jgi:DnaK suppressor protein
MAATLTRTTRSTRTPVRAKARTATRNAELRLMLTNRRTELQAEVASGLRIGRAGRPKEGGDNLEDSDAMVQGDIAISLLQMRAEMLTRIEQAIQRLDAGRYGSCTECGCDISERRLRALPFAVRCQECEGEREQVHGRAERVALQKGSFWLLSEKNGS